MAFAGIDSEFAQYDSSLPEEVKVVPVGGFPKYAYKEELARSQVRISKRREEEKARGGERRVEFVNASSANGGKVMDGVRGKGSAAERVMAGLERDKSRSPAVSDSGLRRREVGEQRKSRFEDKHERKRERSRSPRR